MSEATCPACGFTPPTHTHAAGCPEALTFDERTLNKVYEGLAEAGIVGQQAIDAVSQMQNRGIRFRERDSRILVGLATQKAGQS